ncbi:RHS repeat-associated core domain-containing protein [Pseudomonas sp. NPDC089554]|uniref:RHS repeat-associated core domain-containing protein n=1 Tax=Pseudomonas sp. NPDC089554 TaxID=3390653 RepID=UPI003D03B8F3
MNRQLGTSQYFYRAGRFATERRGGHARAVFSSTEYLLAERHSDRLNTQSLLAVDRNSSVLARDISQGSAAYRYTPYGHSPETTGALNLLAFNGQRQDRPTRFYLLGDGHRGYSPALFRFLSADSLSPFDAGGINAYAYCGGDPINRVDPSGQNWISSLFKGIGNLFGRTKSRNRVTLKSADNTLDRLAAKVPTIRPHYADRGRRDDYFFHGQLRTVAAQRESKRDAIFGPSRRSQKIQTSILEEKLKLASIEDRIKIQYSDINYLEKSDPSHRPRHQYEQIERLQDKASKTRSRIREHNNQLDAY